MIKSVQILLEIRDKVVVVVKGNQKAPFSQRCKGGRDSFAWIAPLYPRYVPYIAKC